ncbi:flagellar motor switch protein FliN [Schlesneria sp. T3-172]|uniref:flagellar motor switch protein FliN n=1 Tax=Schlesneria sphaerica TaxID=3373610 RepID=UPI0037C6EC43
MPIPDPASFAGFNSNWPDGELPPDQLLNSVERSLSEVILGSMPEPVESPPPAVASTPAAQRVQSKSVPPPSVLSPVTAADTGGLTLDDLGDVELDIAIELGRSELLIDEVMKLREGSVVTLDKLAGDPVDIIANGKLIARGELLVIDGMFGVRLSEVL